MAPPAPFAAATSTWFADAFSAPTRVQALGWPVIASGAHTLLLAPTGSGKTLAAFLFGIDQASRLPEDAPAGVRVLYVSPLKALVYDVERNLRAPLVGIQRTAERLQLHARRIGIDVRTGDTPQRERARQRRDPAEILVTTPESLFLLLGGGARDTLRTVHTVIVDEIHAMAASKRGTHLAVSLERLCEVTEREPQRIGLSATVRPVEEVARFLGGDRPVEIVDAAERPRLQLQVVATVPDMDAPQVGAEREGGSLLGELAKREAGDPPGGKPTKTGLWPTVYPELLRLVRAHRSTILFTNSRGLCERLANQLNEMAGEELVLAHHGSVSHERRRVIEEALKGGSLKGIVATSSLELGIDMGAVDLVILVESPGSVARGLQRVGRAGHGVGEVSQGVLFPKFRGDLLETAVVAERMLRGELEALRVPANALDVLAQQVVAMVCDKERTVDELERLLRRAHPYRALSRKVLVNVLDMLSGRYPSDDLADLRPKLAWDRTRDVLSPRRGTSMLLRMNAGTIPDRGQFAVHLGVSGPRIGELDEEMVYESRNGDVILLGASAWRIVDIQRDRLVVEPAPGEHARLPFWRGDGLGRPIELGRALGAFTRMLGELPAEQAEAWLQEHTPLDRFAAKNLAAYLAEQKEATGTLPTDRSITVERFRDELGDWRVCILSPFGARVHAPWAMALQTSLSRRASFEVVSTYTDDGIVLTFADADQIPDVDALLPDPDELEMLVTDQLTGSALFGAGFRENAARALLLPRRSPRARSPLWAQRLKAKNLMAAALRYPDFPIVLETYRQCLQDHFDLPALAELLRGLRSRTVRVDDVATRRASPFARSLVFAHVASYLYEYDAPLAERRAQALGLDRELLRELLGETDLRTLIDPVVLDDVEAELQAIAPERRARDADELHDVLRRLGALTRDEIVQRSAAEPSEWLARLVHERRAIAVRVAGRDVFLAAQDAGLYRDALGTMPPAGLPGAFLVEEKDALATLVRRYARARGPFTLTQLAAAFGLREAQFEPTVERLLGEGLLARGALRPGGAAGGVEWCDADVLRALRRRTLAKLRGEVAAVDAFAYARFLAAWHGLDAATEVGARAWTLREVVVQLEGCPLPWSVLAGEILPARVPGFTLDALDVLAAAGEVVWVGCGALGSSDGRVALYRRETAAVVLTPPAPWPTATPLHDAVVAALQQRGACFSTELLRTLRQHDAALGERELLATLADLAWAGVVTNDTFAPLRAFASAGSRGKGPRARPLAGGRWALVSSLIDEATAPTERTHARAELLLQRYGVVGRECALAEGIEGGYTAVYEVLKAMEEVGRIRRGHFVDGLTGAQFALAGAVDRLRTFREAPRDGEVRVLAATDPANPWGGLLPWPQTGGEAQLARRVPGASLVTVDGRPALYVSSNHRALVTFPGTDPAALSSALSALSTLRGRLLVVERIDGRDVAGSEHVPLLEAHGFVRDYRGFVLRA
ncbi:MAG: DEAD/DEAH box helicase [Planctomycetota bacterium]